MCRQNKIKPSKIVPSCSPRLLLQTWKQSWAKSLQRKNFNRKKNKNQPTKKTRMIGEYWRTFLYTDQKSQSDNEETVRVVKTTTPFSPRGGYKYPLWNKWRTGKLKAVNTNQKVGSIDHPYGKQKGTRSRRQPRELGQLRHFFLKYRETSCCPCGGQ